MMCRVGKSGEAALPTCEQTKEMVGISLPTLP